MQTAHHERASAANRPRWDSLVWLCGAGLATAVLMVLILLGLILHQGLRVFWPDPVAEITLQPDATSRIGDSPVLAGPIVEKRRSVKRGVVEWQLFTGNKDAYGAMFRHLDADDVLRVEFPRSIAVAERVAFGKAIFHPVALTTPEGQRIEAADAGFWQALDQAVAEVRQRYREIAQLERSGIGPISRPGNALPSLRSASRPSPRRPAGCAASCPKAALNTGCRPASCAPSRLGNSWIFTARTPCACPPKWCFSPARSGPSSASARVRPIPKAVSSRPFSALS